MNIEHIFPCHQIILYLTSNEAHALLGDFDNRREPSPAGKRLYTMLHAIQGYNDVSTDASTVIQRPNP